VKDPQGRNSPATTLLELIAGCKVRVFVGTVSDNLAIITSFGDIINPFLAVTVDDKGTKFSHFD
jgi:hypothetical protein